MKDFFGDESIESSKSGEDLECRTDNWNESDYVFPYFARRSYRINQGNNNTCGGYQGAYKYGYDFDMPIGSVVIASRAGTISEVRDDNPDGEDLFLGNENLVKILQTDGTTATYSHLKQGSVTVSVDLAISQGDTLGLSGNSGYTGNFPLLHFHVSNCNEPTSPGCKTILVKFRNTDNLQS